MDFKKNRTLEEFVGGLGLGFSHVFCSVHETHREKMEERTGERTFYWAAYVGLNRVMGRPGSKPIQIIYLLFSDFFVELFSKTLINRLI